MSPQTNVESVISSRYRLMAFVGRHVTKPRAHAAVYRLSRGRIGSRMPMVKPGVLLLTTTGRRSGEPRTTPLIYFHDGDRLAVAATNSGTGKTPAWLLNLRQDAKADLQIGAEVITATATEVAGAERDRIWSQVVEEHPLYSVYEQQAPREIPVVVLDPDDTG